MGVTGFVFEISAAKAKIRVFLQCFPLATVTSYVTTMNESFSAITGV